jgi:hypothetical protein
MDDRLLRLTRPLSKSRSAAVPSAAMLELSGVLDLPFPDWMFDVECAKRDGGWMLDVLFF